VLWTNRSGTLYLIPARTQLPDPRAGRAPGTGLSATHECGAARAADDFAAVRLWPSYRGALRARCRNRLSAYEHQRQLGRSIWGAIAYRPISRAFGELRVAGQVAIKAGQ